MTKRDHTFETIRNRAHIAATNHPRVEHHISIHFAYGQPLNNNETGIKPKNAISDPTGNQATTRGNTSAELDHLRHLRHRIVEAFNDYDNYARRIWGQDRPAPPNDAPTCYIAGCDREVGSYLRDDKSTAYRMGGEYGGMCDMHRMQTVRDKQRVTT